MFREQDSNVVVYSLKDLRKHLRSQNSLGTPVEMYLEADRTFTAPLKGMIMDRAFEGCGLVLATAEQLQLEQICWLKFKEDYVVKVKIVWLDKLEEQLWRLGVEYISPKLKIILNK